MYGLPDSAVVGTVKRLNRRRRKSTTEVGWEDFFFLVNAVKHFRARRRAQKARAQFYKKNGYYKH